MNSSNDLNSNTPNSEVEGQGQIEEEEGADEHNGHKIEEGADEHNGHEIEEDTD